MTRVLITRPEPGATRTLNALVARDINAAAIPLTEIQALAFNPPVGDYDALIITSQNAVIHGAALLAQLTAKPVFVVGKRTAKLLRGHHIAASAENAADLLPLIISHSPKTALYICGQTRRPELKTGLAKANIHVEAVEIYSALPTQNAPSKLETFFSLTQNAIILFHAPSAAEFFILAMKDQKLPETTRFLCMSAVIAAQLPLAWQDNVTLAARPDETAMIDQLDKMLARDHMPKA